MSFYLKPYHHAESSWLASAAMWFGTNLLYYVGGAVVFGIGFFIFATVYARLYPAPPHDVPPLPPASVSPVSPVPTIAPPSRMDLLDAVANLKDKDLIGKKLVIPDGIVGYIVVVNRDQEGKIIWLGVSKVQHPDANTTIIPVKVAPDR